MPLTGTLLAILCVFAGAIIVSTDHNRQSKTAETTAKKGKVLGVTGTLTSRSIRSFVIRNGRMTEAQQDALENALPIFGITFTENRINFDEAFDRAAPTWIEIGFGNGDALLHLAEQHPEVNVVGVEVHSPGVGHALMGIQSRQLKNVRIIQHDAMEVLQQMVAPQSLARVMLFFPDPWHKKRHHKRRIVQDEFVTTVSSRLQSGGLLHCATDVSGYAEWMLEHLQRSDDLVNESPNNDYVEQPTWRINTRFERRGQRLGHEVFDLLYRRT